MLIIRQKLCKFITTDRFIRFLALLLTVLILLVPCGVITANAANWKMEVASVKPCSDTTVEIDGLDWYVLYRDDSDKKALIFSKDVVEEDMQFSCVRGQHGWNNSSLKDYLNKSWIIKRPILNSVAIEEEVKMREALVKNHMDFLTSKSKVFFLSLADLFGEDAFEWRKKAEFEEYTCSIVSGFVPINIKSINPKILKTPSHHGYYLRTICDVGGDYVYVVRADGTPGNAHYFWGRIAETGVRPALWINFS